MANPFRQQIDILLAKAFTRWPVLGRLWSKVVSMNANTDVPWTPVTKPLGDCRVCLITTGGLHLTTDHPFKMDDPKGDPSFRVIPANVQQDELTITHNYYDHSDADGDFNILLPLDRVRELTAAGHLAG